MASYSVDTSGKKTYYSKYERSGVLSMKSILPESKETTNLVKLKAGKGDKVAIHKATTGSTLARRIFYSCIEAILERVADGDVFILPGTTGAHILLKKTPDKEVKMMRQMGLFKDIDIIKTGLNIPRFTFDFGPKYTRRDRQIHVTKALSNRAYRNAEAQRLPWLLIRKILNNDNTFR